MKTITVMLLLATLAPHPARADGVAVFDLAPGARAAAMGFTGTADGTDAIALVNPALASAQPGVSVYSAYGNWSGDVDHFTNAFAWSGDTGPVTLGVGLAHSRLEFKTYRPDYGYLPFNTQSSFMTFTVAVRRAIGRAAVSAGASLVWSTSNGGGDDLLADAGVCAEGPPLETARATVRYALAASSLHGGAGPTSPPGGAGFSPGPGEDALRYGLSLRAEAGAVAVRVDADAVDRGRDGGADATAAGVEISLWETVHARAGYGDGTVSGVDVVTAGVGVGRRLGELLVRVDYAHIEDAGSGNAFSTDVFGGRLALDF